MQLLLSPEGLSTEEFNALSFRCGRILLEAGEVTELFNSTPSFLYTCTFTNFPFTPSDSLLLPHFLFPSSCPLMQYCWRWTGFSFGFDVLVQYDTNPGYGVASSDDVMYIPYSRVVTPPLLKRNFALKRGGGGGGGRNNENCIHLCVVTPPLPTQQYRCHSPVPHARSLSQENKRTHLAKITT